MIEKGASYDDLLQQLDFMIAHAEHILSIADMDWLVKGGRINKLAGKTLKMIFIRHYRHQKSFLKYSMFIKRRLLIKKDLVT